ncbi:MAG: TMEM175 family protein [Cyclobacteriaceae bacterium]
MRQSLKDQEVGLDSHFNYRGKNQTRVETFSDAAFALAITLMVLSSTVPNNLNDLLISMKDIIPFGICVVIILVIWYQHYIYFLRYGLQNLTVISLNTFLIFLILIYVYPLKFLFKVLIDLYINLFTGDQESIQVLFTTVIPISDARFLMIIYGLGAALIYGTLALMYRYALQKKQALQLNDYEIFKTKESIRTNLLMTSVPMLSTIIAVTGLFGSYNFIASGVVYMLYPPVMITHGRLSSKKAKRMLEKK